jgi:hypothetical protein
MVKNKLVIRGCWAEDQPIPLGAFFSRIISLPWEKYF